MMFLSLLLLAAVFLVIAYLVRTTKPIVSALVAGVSTFIAAAWLAAFGWGFLIFSGIVFNGGPTEAEVAALGFVALVAATIFFSSLQLVIQAIRRMKLSVTPPPPPAS